jgi:hypothetical protein
VAHEPDPAAKESLAALLGALIADAKDLLVRELRLAQLEVRQTGLLMYYPAAVVYHCPDSDRVTTAYLRRWYFRIGEWEAHKTLLGQNRTHTIFTVPRWHYRKLLEHVWRAGSLTLSGRRREGFSHELQGMSSLGYLFGAPKNTLRRIPYFT